MKQAIEVIVSPNGEIQINAVGFEGADCQKATRFLEEALGVVSKRVKKPEYHHARQAKLRQKAGV